MGKTEVEGEADHAPEWLHQAQKNSAISNQAWRWGAKRQKKK